MRTITRERKKELLAIVHPIGQEITRLEGELYVSQLFEKERLALRRALEILRAKIVCIEEA